MALITSWHRTPSSKFAASTGDIVVTLHADGSADPQELPRFVDALLSGAEAAHGSRFRPGGDHRDAGAAERFGHGVLCRVVNVFFGTRFTDLSCGYNAYWRELLPVLELPAPDARGPKRGRLARGEGPEIDTLTTLRMATQGLRVVEVATIGYPRIHGEQRPRRLLPAALRALRTAWSEYVRRWRIGRRPSPRRDELPDYRRHAAAARYEAPAHPAARYEDPAYPAARHEDPAYPDARYEDAPYRDSGGEDRWYDRHPDEPAGRHAARRSVPPTRDRLDRDAPGYGPARDDRGGGAGGRGDGGRGDRGREGRRLDRRRAGDPGRPDLTVIRGEGRDDRWDDPPHLRTVPGENFRRR